ncbi:MAG TPA: xylulokinase [Armatimonadetes bacterium]|nr:xylulokinase [Armatimonadota bacterium]
MSRLLGIDLGTTGVKTIVVEAEDARLAGSCTVEYPLLTPRPGWTEQEPEAWWSATVESLRGALAAAGGDASDIVGIGLSGQMHGSVFLDAGGRVIRPAILWNDQRTAEQCAWITRAGGRKLIAEEIRNPILTGFQAPKIIWLRDNEPANFDRVRHVLLPKDFLRLRLTGEYATEVSDASGTALLNVPARDWSTEFIDRLGLPAAWFPKVHESPTVTGQLTAEVAELTGLVAGTPVVGGAGDCAAGAVGTGIVEPGLLWASTGTSGVIFASAAEPATDPDLRTHTFCHAVPGAWHVMGVVLSAGGSLRWYRDTLAADERSVAELTGQDPYQLITAAADRAPVGSEGLVFLPYLTGERTPHADPSARGAFLGLSLRHDKRHMARAVLEGVAFALRDSVEIMRAQGVPITEVRASGGGARSAAWRQIQADIFGHPLATINIEEGAALGVALLAGVGAGLWASVPEACQAVIRTATLTEPIEANVQRYNEIYEQLYAPVYPLLRDYFATGVALVERQSD